MRGTPVLPVFVAAFVVTSRTAAQKVPERTLSKPEIEFAQPFSEVTAIRELRDGRVIVVDGRELKAQVIDFRAGTVATIGRNGDGPGEYRWPRQLYALPGDSSLLPDLAGGRLLIITPDAKPGELLNLNPPDVVPTRRFLLRFSDTLGRLYGEAQPIRIGADGVAQLADSSAIERLDRASHRRDTVAFVPLRKDAGARLVNGIGIITQPRRQPFPGWDHWLVAPDGRIAFVFYDPYRVDYVAPNHAITHGKPIPYDRVKVDDALKRQWREDRERPTMAMSSRGGATSIGPMKMPYSEPSEWPEYLPPYTSGLPLFSSDGTLWITRAMAAGVAPTFDLINRKGELMERIVLPQRSKLVGFGNGTVYVVRLDDDDLQYLQRYRFGTPTGR